ncbi:TRAP transporter small permease [Pontibaca salina]|nr:TRAP transporter small permease [Pontibaca salina]
MNDNKALTGSDPFLRVTAAISTLCGWIAAGMVVAAVFITCQMIFVRFVLNHSTIWQTEAVVYLVIAATLIGLPYVQRLKGHVNVDLIPIALQFGPRKVLYVVVLSASALVMGMLAFYGYDFWQVAYQRGWKSDTVWGVRLWIPYLAIPVGFGLMTLQIVADIWAVLKGHERPFGLVRDPLNASGTGEL